MKFHGPGHTAAVCLALAVGTFLASPASGDGLADRLKRLSVAKDVKAVETQDAEDDAQPAVIGGAYGDVTLDMDMRVSPTGPDTGPPIWQTPATLYVARCTPPDLPRPPPDQPPCGVVNPPPRIGEVADRDPFEDFSRVDDFGGPVNCGGSPLPYYCGLKPASKESTIVWHTDETPLAVATSSAKVRFGPFRLVRKGTGGASEGTDKFEIMVNARSPAVYAPDGTGQGRFVGTYQDFQVIGYQEFELSGSEEKDVYVEATLRSAHSAIRIETRVDDELSVFPAGCTGLPDTASDPSSFDSACLQGNLNPTAAISAAYIPIGIIYEPPGNCSWSRLENMNGSGVTIGVGSTSEQTERIVTDTGFFWDREHTDFTSESTDSRSGSTSVYATNSTFFGTRLALSSESPGNPDCNRIGFEPPPRENAGPGYGEKFLLLKDAPLLYWDTENFRATQVAPVSLPFASGSLLPVTAQQLRTGDGLPDGVEFDEDMRDALLGLSPFQVDETGELRLELPEDRYVQIGKPILLPVASAFEYSQSNQWISETGRTLTSSLKTAGGSTDSDPAVDISMQVLTATLTAALQTVSGKALVALNSEFADYNDDITKKIKLPTIYTDQSTTTTTIKFEKTSRIRELADSAVTQRFYIQDTNEPLGVVVMYDRLFGSIAFVPLEPGAGFTQEADLLRLPTYVASSSNRDRASGFTDLSGDDLAELKAMGAVTVTPVAPSRYSVLDEYSKVQMLSTLYFRPDEEGRLRLPKTAVPDSGSTQSLYVVENGAGEPVAKLWVNSN